MSYTKIWIHLVWSTKYRAPVLTKVVRTKLFQHIRENASAKDIYIDFINGYVDHVHVLISLKPDQSIAHIARLIKGESSYWLNQQQLIPERFEWQTDYFAMSVSESGLNRVREYIKNQEQHHAEKTYLEEYEEYLLCTGLKPGTKQEK